MTIDTDVDRLAPSRATVLIDGGTRQARADVARALHDRSQRRTEAFTVVDCAAASHDDLQEILGGPVSQRRPRTAGLGTLFLANIEAVPRCLQPRLLGFLDDGGRPRVVVAAGIDLARAALEGQLRPDLASRLLLIRVTLPTAP